MDKRISLPTYDEPLTAMLRLSSRGLYGADKTAMEKRAGAWITDAMSRLQFHPGEVPVHLLAMGATETTGVNRNGDGFPKESLERDHGTFTKFAWFYRDHRNSDPLRSYGRVAESWYNPTMGRVELIVALNGTKEAAARNTGLVADKELELLESGQDVPVSMATRVPFDICSYCQKKSATSRDYCRDVKAGGSCRAGGLATKMGSIIEIDGDLHHLHAINDINRFFDISHVVKQADRIAYVTGILDQMFRPGLKQASGVTEIPTIPPLLSPRGVSPEAARVFKTAERLAQLEIMPETLMKYAESIPYAAADFSSVPEGSSASLAKALAGADVVLPLSGFLQVFGKQSAENARQIAATVQPHLAYVFTQLTTAPGLPEKVAAVSDMDGAAQPTIRMREWARGLQESWGVSKAAASRRAVLSTVRQKHASVAWSAPFILLRDTPADALVQTYALYKLGAVSQYYGADDFALTTALAVAQNRQS